MGHAGSLGSTQPSWILEQGLQPSDEFHLMGKVLRQRHCQVFVQPWRPFTSSIEKVLQAYPTSACVVVHGSVAFCVRMAQKAPWTPSLWLDPRQLECTAYYSYWGPYIFQQDHAFYTFAEARRKQTKLLEHFSVDGCVFVRPNSSLKTFTGQVVPGETLDKWFSDTQQINNIDPTTLVVVARPRPITREWRLIVRGRTVVAASLYRDHGALRPRPDLPDKVARFAAVILHQAWQPHPIYVLDVVESSLGHLSVLEIGSVNVAGFYGCSLSAVLTAMNQQALLDWEEIQP